jgi:predicted nucleic acid-binding protein
MIVMGVFLDTNFFLSLVHPKDSNAKRGGELLQELSTGIHGLLYTSNLVIAEAATLTAARTKGNSVILQDLEDLFYGESKLAEILPVTGDIERETWKLFKQVNANLRSKAKLMSFIDISHVILAQRHQLEKIVSFDDHFDRFLTRLF